MAVCPLGLLTMDNIYDMYAMPKHRAKIFINQIFKLFDKNNSGEITFRVRVGDINIKISLSNDNNVFFAAICVGH